MADVSEHNESSIRDFSGESEQLRLRNKELAENVDKLNQEVYSLRNRTLVAEKIRAEYQSELDSQQQQIIDLKASHALEILKLKDQHFKVYQDLESKLLSLETENQDIQKKHAGEKEEFLKTKKELRDFQDESPIAAIQAELQEVLEEHAANRVACMQHLDLNKILLKEKSDLMEELKSTKEHLEMTEEKLKIFKNDLMELSDKHEDLKESYAVLQSELSCLKAAPAEDVGRGNSIFAEVEDRRQAMLQKCSTLASKYNHMKKDYGAKCKEISKLKSEIAYLHRQMLDELEDRDNKEVWLKDNYEIRIKELVKTVEDLKLEEKPVFLSGESKILKYSENMVNKAKKEMAELRKEMERRSSLRLNEAKALYIARSELHTLKTQVMSVHAENLVLRDTLEMADITDIPSPTKTLKRLKDMLDNSDKDLDPFRLKTVPLELSQEPTSVEDNVPSKSDISVSPTLTQNTEFTAKPIEEAAPRELPSEVLYSEISPSEIPLNKTAQSEISSSEISSSAASSRESSPSKICPDETLSSDTLGVDKLPSRTLVLSSLPIVSIPKPSRLLKVEMIEKIQSGNTSSASVQETSQLQVKIMEKFESVRTSNESNQDKDEEVTNHTEPLLSSSSTEFCDENTAPNDENLEVSSPNCVEASPSSSALKTSSDSESSQFIPTSLIKPISCVRIGKENNGTDWESHNLENGHSVASKESDLDNEQQGICTTLAPTRSILAKPSRPSLLPIDQNLSVRKVRFAESESDPSNVPGEGESQSPKKKLTRVSIPKYYKKRVLVSKDTEF